jgi:hypothetical protein
MRSIARAQTCSRAGSIMTRRFPSIPRRPGRCVRRGSARRGDGGETRGERRTTDDDGARGSARAVERSSAARGRAVDGDIFCVVERRAREVRGTDFRNGCVFRRRRACPPPSFKRARR